MYFQWQIPNSDNPLTYDTKINYFPIKFPNYISFTLITHPSEKGPNIRLDDSTTSYREIYPQALKLDSYFYFWNGGYTSNYFFKAFFIGY